ncbi:MAG: RIP metalloprotease RseP [Candidatus Desulfofervidaceae bacterium]|nr:RIP metalloprotease RseP [Candidatus Desulfofervidaceae bacterium]
MPIFWTIIILGLLIFVHEWGHFLMARWCGVGVRTFSLGFGPKLVGKCIGRTEYVISAVPLGGYVKLVGESPQEYISEEERYIAFTYQPLWKRTLIVLAGPLFNVLFALVVFISLFAISGKPLLLPKIGNVQPESPAAIAGVQKGDLILAIDNKPVTTWDELAKAIRKHKGTFLTLLLQRNNEKLRITLRPKIEKIKTLLGDEIERPIIGIVAAGEVKIEHLSPWGACWEGLKQTWFTTKLTILTIKNLILGKLSFKMLAGPIGIIQLTTKQAQAGLAALFSFAALISINLGIINLLPIPVLDGGHLFFYGIEAIRRRPLSVKTMEITQRVGIAILVLLMLIVMYNDILRIVKQTTLP